jgi:hypothetical protein
MAYHVFILKFEGSPEDFRKLPAQWKPALLGDAAEVRAKISQVWADVDWSDPQWGRVTDGSLEFQMPVDPSIDHFRLNIRGGDPFPSICTLCKTFGWAAVDGSFGTLLDLDNPSREGLHGWQRYAKGIVHGRPAGARESPPNP